MDDKWMFPGDFANPEVPAQRAMQSIVSDARQRPTAIVCASDWTAAATIKAARSMGIDVPTDLSVTGFDDSDISMLFDPPVTTISLPAEDCGRLAANNICARLEGLPEPSMQPLPCRLVIRGSTAAVSSSG